MRLYTIQKTIVDLKHFRACAKHIALLVTLQQEMPNLPLEINAEKLTFIPIHRLDLENQTAIRGLNPNQL